MTDEIGANTVNNDDGEVIAKPEKRNDIETKDSKDKTRSVSFNRDVHVKRFGKPREPRTTSTEPQQPIIRKEPFTHLSAEELLEEADKVRAQAESVTCTADHPPEKFFSLPHRKKLKQEERRNSDDNNSVDGRSKTLLGRSTSDASTKKGKERTSFSTLFRKSQKPKPPIEPIVVPSKPAIVKRSKSDVSDLKSNTKLNAQSKPIRKRSGSETEEFLKSLRNKKTQLSPIIESSPREDYFKRTPPLEAFQKQKIQKENEKPDDPVIDSKKINPIEKPPRYKTPEVQEPKPPVRTKRGKSSEKEKSPPITSTPKRKTDIKKKLIVDEIDTAKVKSNTADKDNQSQKIKDSIKKIEENVYATTMKHSSQQPPDKPPLTRGQTVGHMVRILKEDQFSPPPKSHLISPNYGSNVNQPFSYTKPSVSPESKMFVRNASPDRAHSPVNKITDKGVVYAQVVRDNGDNGSNKFGKQTVHTTYPSKEKYGNFSDEDEGLGYEEKHRRSTSRLYDDGYKSNENENFSSMEGPPIMDSPIKPKFREYKLTSFNDLEPTYANEYPSKKDTSQEYFDSFRGRGDGMDTKRKPYEPEITRLDLDFNELSHRRQLLESRLNARKYEKNRVNVAQPSTRYLVDNDPIYEAEKRMKATEKYVNETARYMRHTLERDGFAESNVNEEYSKYDSENNRIKYNTESRTYEKSSKDNMGRREFIDRLGSEPRLSKSKIFPPEPEYEPPSLEFQPGKPITSPNEFKEKKYKVKKHITSSHDVLQTGQKYKVKDDWFGRRKGHYASNPEITKEREDDYANLPLDPKQAETYHNSLRRIKNKERYRDDYGIKRHDSGDSRDYYRDNQSPRRFDFDSRLVDSGIENDFRKDSSVELHRSRRKYESDEDVRNTSMFLASERQHTNDNYSSEQIYGNGEHTTKYSEKGYQKDYIPRERSVDDGSHFEPRSDRFDRSPSKYDDKISAKPPKAKKLSGLEKVKQLFSRDSSKKSKKEKEAVQPKTRTRVLKSPEHLGTDDPEYRRYTDPEPSDMDTKKKDYDPKELEIRYKNSREDLDRFPSHDNTLRKKDFDREDKYKSSRESLDKHRSSERDSDVERRYRDVSYSKRYERTGKEDLMSKDHKERRYNSSDRESDQHSKPSDAESDRKKSRSRTVGPLDSPALAERYRERRRLATPSPTPTPSPPRREPTTGWFKSLDRLARKKKDVKVERKESILTTEDEAPRKPYKKLVQSKPLTSPAKNLRFFGDTDQDSDTPVKPSIPKPKSHQYKHSTLRKTISNSSTGLDEVDHADLTNKSYSLTNLREERNESPKNKYHKRNLHNISEVQSNSETESNFDRRLHLKPPVSPYERSRSHSSSKTLKGSKNDVRRHGRSEERGSSSELRSSRPELNRDLKPRRRTPAHSGGSSTEGDSSQPSQRSVVYLHATTVGDIPNPDRLTRNRSRDDVSSVNSSNLQVRSTTKSFSIFAPWTPRHYNDQREVHYAQRPRRSKPRESLKSTSTQNLNKPATLQKNKSYSQTTLTRKPQNTRLTSSNTTLNRKTDKHRDNDSVTTLSRKPERNKKSQSSELLNRDLSERVSRSVSMPKDNNKKAGWFKLSNKNKKQEINSTRVR